MYQYVWFDKKRYTDKSPVVSVPENYIKCADIECVRKSFWTEHCLECAVPLCYFKCPNWVERYDQKCQKFFYGIKCNRDNTTDKFSAKLKYRKWGKMRSLVSCETSTLEREIRCDKINRVIEQMALVASKILRCISKKCKPNGLISFLNNQRIISSGRKHCSQEAETFLLQCISSEESDYNLYIDILINEKLVYKESVLIKYGFNQFLIDTQNCVNFGANKEVAVEIYPENNIEAELEFLISDFVHLKPTVVENLSKKSAETVKCLAWDLDNTLWNGILIESDPTKLALKEGVLEAIEMLDQRGIIQIVLSKNEHSDVESVLKRLGILEMFVAFGVNWSSKSENLQRIADKINININTFALIDDSAFERGEMQSQLPMVRVYKETQIAELLGYNEFNVPSTDESKNRRKMYQEEYKREVIKESFSDNIRFLENCHLEIVLSAVDSEAKINRALELLQRTNQLNLSGKKYTYDEFVQLLNNNASYAIFANDKYGSYGQIALLIFAEQEEKITVIEFCMSCRTAKKYLESALFNWLQSRGKNIILIGENNNKNGLLIKSLIEIGFEDQSPDDKKLVFLLEKGTQLLHGDIVGISDVQSRNM